MKSLLLLSICSLLTSFAIQSDQSPHYFHQTPPGIVPKVFAPGIISLEDEYEFGSVFNAAGTEFYYGVNVGGKEQIRYSIFVEGEWTAPKTLMEQDQYGSNDPFLSPDENRLYFISQRPKRGQTEENDYDIWYLERRGEEWSEPINAGPAINTDRNEYYISFTENTTMYFSSNKGAPEDRKWDDFDIYSSDFVDGEFQEAVRLGNTVNTEEYEADVFVAPDESYLIFCANRAGGYGQGDLYISFKQTDGSWSQSENMGDAINTRGHELCPFVTMDGKYLFYTSNQDIYWVSTEIFKTDE